MTPIDGLTREQILAMEPGRELDVLAGTEIMGWEYIPASSPSAGLIVQDHFFDPKTGDAHFVWSPSTDISAAFEVWEHDRPDNWTMNLLSPRKGIYKTEIIEHTEKGIKWLGIVESKSAAEAMSKCRLLAVMGE